jgi:hypothetical protein
MKMRELFSDASKWSRGASARNARGLPTEPLEPDARSWCLMGAFRRCYPIFDDRSEIRRAIDDAIGRNWPEWNDAHGFAGVRALVTRLAI